MKDARRDCDQRDPNSARGAKRSLRELLRKFREDRSGSYLMITALAAPIFVGAAALATENGLLLYTHQKMQGAADAGAFSAAQALAGSTGPSAGSQVTPEAKAVAAQYGFVDGLNDTTVTVNRPPLSGKLAGKSIGVEVIIKQKQVRLFSALWGKDKLTVRSRSVSQAGTDGFGCVLALDPSASGTVTATGSTTVHLNSCDLYDDSNSGSALSGSGSAAVYSRQDNVVGDVSGAGTYHTENGILTSSQPIPDPYADVNFPSFFGCNQNNFSANGKKTISPGVYCNGMKFNANADVTFNPGVYYIDRGDLTINGGAFLHGTGVTIVLTSSTGSNYATVTINGNASVNLTAPNSGTLSGIVVFADRDTPLGTSYKFNGGASTLWGGALYLPKGAIQWSGNQGASTNCTQIIGDTITFTGNSDVAIHCTGFGTRPIGLSTALVE